MNKLYLKKIRSKKPDLHYIRIWTSGVVSTPVKFTTDRSSLYSLINIFVSGKSRIDEGQSKWHYIISDQELRLVKQLLYFMNDYEMLKGALKYIKNPDDMKAQLDIMLMVKEIDDTKTNNIH